MKMFQCIKQTGCLFACLLLLSQCGGEPYTYEPDHELKPGPGLFSGEDGEFKLISPDDAMDKKQSEEQDAPPQKIPQNE